uniref:HTH luxR-type domain-containing protein n=1 Tax=Caenorhabditis japonica TaxID=281687 RepID=A0A8R1ITE3_CAEJA
MKSSPHRPSIELLFKRGLGSAEIARRLQISSSTVRILRRHFAGGPFYPSTRLGTVPWLEIDIGRLGGAFPWIPGQELVACFQPGSQSDGF